MFHNTIVKRMHEAVVLALQAAQPHMVHRNGSFELYGLDFVIDSAYQPWCVHVPFSSCNAVDGCGHRARR